MPPAYETYRRVQIEELSWLARLYNILLALVICAAVPWMLLARGHLKATPLDVSVFIRGADADNPSLMRCPAASSGEGEAVGVVDTEACVEWDWLELIDSSPSHVFVVTHVSEELQRRGCPRSALRCGATPLWRGVRNASYVLAGPEHMRLVFEHRADDVSIAAAATHFEGGPDVVPNRRVESIEGLLLGPEDCVSESARWASFGRRGEEEGGTRPSLRVRSRNGHDVFAVTDILAATARGTGDGDGPLLTPERRRRGVHIDLSLQYSNLWLDGGGSGRDNTDPEGAVSATWGWAVFGAFTRLWRRAVPTPGPLRYTMCATLKEGASSSGALFIQTAESSRMFPDPAAVDDSPDTAHEATIPRSLREYRIVKELHGVMIHMRTGNSMLHAVDVYAALSFVATACSLLSLPYLVTETLMAVLLAIGKGGRWSSALLRGANG